MNHVRSNVLLLVLTLAICCVLYPAVLYAVGSLAFPSGATGSTSSRSLQLAGSAILEASRDHPYY